MRTNVKIGNETAVERYNRKKYGKVEIKTNTGTTKKRTGKKDKSDKK